MTCEGIPTVMRYVESYSLALVEGRKKNKYFATIGNLMESLPSKDYNWWGHSVEENMDRL